MASQWRDHCVATKQIKYVHKLHTLFSNNFKHKCSIKDEQSVQSTNLTFKKHLGNYGNDVIVN